MTFATPLMLLLLLPLGLAAWRLLRRGRRSGIRFSATSRLPAKTAGWRAKLASLTPFILLAGLALLIVAAARPRTPLAHDKKSIDAIAIAMTVDVSGSMDALDLAPSGTDFRNPSKKLEEWTRLSVVKRLFAEFVEKRPDDLIAVVAEHDRIPQPYLIFFIKRNCFGRIKPLLVKELPEPANQYLLTGQLTPLQTFPAAQVQLRIPPDHFIRALSESKLAEKAPDRCGLSRLKIQKRSVHIP